MWILAVDTSTRQGSLAVLQDTDVVAEHASDANVPYSESLIPDVEELLSRAGISMTSIDLFSVVSGPGSFTGLRVGLTAVKAWAEVLCKGVAAVSGLEAIASQVRSLGTASEPCLIASVLDARRGQIFGGVYKCEATPLDGDGLEPLGEEIVASPEEFIAMASARAGASVPVFASPTPDMIAAPVSRSSLRGARIVEVSGALAPAVGRLGYLRALRGDVRNALGVDANYVRRSDAELNWKGAWGAPIR